MVDDAATQVIDRSKGQWFVLHTLSGQENSVREKLGLFVTQADPEIPVYEVLIPSETVTEVRQGKKRQVSRKIFPGYVYIRMDLYLPNGDLNEPAWYAVRETKGVISFVGGRDNPIPLGADEVEDLMRQTEEMENKTVVQTKVPAYVVIGGTVRITDGAFANFEGLIEEIDAEHGKLKLLVSIFGRSTPVELEFWQVGPDEE